MKKIVLVSAALLLTFFSFAQGPAEIAIFAGPQMTNTSYYIKNVKQESKAKYGFQAGVAMKVPFDGRLFFAPSAYYSMKGYKVKYNLFAYPPDPAAADNNTTIHCFELAPMLQIDLGKNPGHMFIKVGPSLDFQLLGKEKYNLTGGGTVDRNMKFGPGEYGTFSANLIGQIGYETANGFMFYAQYSHGAASINNADGGPAIRHRVFGISIGKYIKRNKIVVDTRNKE